MGLENIVIFSRRFLIGSLVAGTMLYGCSKDKSKDNPVSPQVSHPPGFPRITHTIVDDYSGSTGLGVSMDSDETIGIWANSVDPDGDYLEYYWMATDGRFEDTGVNSSTGYFTRWIAPHISRERGSKSFHISVYADDGELRSDDNTLGIIVNPR